MEVPQGGELNQCSPGGQGPGREQCRSPGRHSIKRHLLILLYALMARLLTFRQIGLKINGVMNVHSGGASHEK